ncbi:hypothetical protein GE061_006847 [Apolygus lucorum]|uniref:Uncharacterized protein n=1 Tax=Apolygus lucorum TaxID=248454 RepID=A0A6A4IW69_APOLU|nr:hypothetical protein GE061_006847 [Apolygus lucorum]
MVDDLNEVRGKSSLTEGNVKSIGDMLVDSQSLLILCLIASVTLDRWVSSDDKCGQVRGRQPRNATGVFASSEGSSPWHATIYRLPSDPGRKLIQICGGTIITKYHILTAASCIYINGCTPVDPKLYRVVVAQTHKALEVDPDAQFREVKYAKVHVKYDGEIIGYTTNVAVLYLDQALILNDYVMPICIDQDPTRSRQLPSVLEASGWGFDSSLIESLNEGVFKTLESRICRNVHPRFKKYVNFDKFCIETPKGSIAEDTGTGLVARIGDLFYLKGVLSVQVDKAVSLVTFAFRYYDWLKSTMIRIEEEKKCDGKFACVRGPCIDLSLRCNKVDNCPDASDEENCNVKCIGTIAVNPFQRYTPPVKTMKCTIPSQIGGASYTLDGCRGDSCVRRSGTELQDGEKVVMTCGKGTSPPDRYDPIFVCTKGDWFPQTPICQKSCPMQTSKNSEAKCEYNRVPVDCGEYLKPGTVVTYGCQRLHRFKDFLPIPQVNCLEGGKWTDNPPKCVPAECGIRNRINLFEPTITYGRNATSGEFPWHIGLYGKQDVKSTDWEYRCGGTIFHQTNLVLTAAHCVFMDDLATNLMLPEQLWVAAGRVLRSLQLREKHEQFSSVKKIIPHRDFIGSRGQSALENDIAILVLKTPLVVTDFVLPCCLGLTFSASTVPNQNGTVVGWGFTEKGLQDWGKRGIASNFLLYTDLPLITNYECRNLDEKAKFVAAPDKFCGLYNKESGPQQGDSGGGLVIEVGHTYQIIGIVSSKPTGSHRYGTFTSIGSHQNWLAQNIRAFAED